MENHPIPQDVTGFKFKLIGSVTIKQFMYLLAAGIFATITFVLPITILIKLPFIMVFVLIGVGLAFIPIDGRPMDVMIMNFARALPAENKYIFHKKGAPIPALSILSMQPKHSSKVVPTSSNLEKKRTMLTQALRKSNQTLDDETSSQVSSILAAFQNPASPLTPSTSQLSHSASSSVQPIPQVAAPQEAPASSIQTPAVPQAPIAAVQPVQLPTQSPTDTPTPSAQEAEPSHLDTVVIPSELSAESMTRAQEEMPTANQTAPTQPTPPSTPVENTEQKIEQVDSDLIGVEEAIKEVQKEEEKGVTAELEAKIAELQEQLKNLTSEKEILVQQMQANTRANNVQRPAPAAQNTPQPEVANATNRTATTADTNPQKKIGFPTLPDVPNVVLGIVKDPRGKVLPNILVEVVDASDMPIRAFKTNALGQFASATPLLNGTYKVLFDDPQKKHEFDTIEIVMDGKSIFQPLEIFSVDQREKLRRELFTQNNFAQS